MLGVVGRDRAFMLFILANLLMMLVYAQVESPLIQYLTRAGAPRWRPWWPCWWPPMH